VAPARHRDRPEAGRITGNPHARRQLIIETGIAYLAAWIVGAGFGWALEWSSAWNGSEWEREMLRWFHAQPLPAWLDEVMLFFPYVGTNLTILPLVLLLGLWLWKKQDKVVTAVHLLVVSIGSLSLNPAMKYLIDRPRPALFPLRGLYNWASYPSGHAILTVALYFTIALQLRYAHEWRWPFAVATVIVLITCYSRLYLAVHWPTDVIGGWAFGALWALLLVRLFAPDRR
jgi:undecaprenyl-diphosphatase